MGNEVFDVFNGDAFSAVSLTARINLMPFVPGRVGRLGIFEEEGISTTKVMIEESNGSLALIPATKRGGVPNQNKHNKNKARSLEVPHLDLEDTILADEVQNVRVFGSADELQGVQAVVDARMKEMNKKHDATIEYQRIRAIQGIVLDADGTTVLFNYFTEFGVAQQTLDFLLGTSTSPVRKFSTDATGMIEDELGADVTGGIYALCGKTWFNSLVEHPKVAEAWKYYQDMSGRQPLKDDLRYKGFEFGGITYEVYRGSVGGIPFVADNEAYAFPLGVADQFKTYFAPGDFIEAVNTLGLPRYAKQAIDPKYQRHVDVLTQSNPLNLNTRPRAVVKLTSSNSP